MDCAILHTKWIWTFKFCVVVSMNKRLNQQLICRWFLRTRLLIYTTYFPSVWPPKSKASGHLNKTDFQRHSVTNLVLHRKTFTRIKLKFFGYLMLLTLAVSIHLHMESKQIIYTYIYMFGDRFGFGYDIYIYIHIYAHAIVHINYHAYSLPMKYKLTPPLKYLIWL